MKSNGIIKKDFFSNLVVVESGLEDSCTMAPNSSKLHNFVVHNRRRLSTDKVQWLPATQEVNLVMRIGGNIWNYFKYQ